MKKVLIIEDEISVRTFFKTMIEKNGYQVFEAADGKQGIRIYKENLPDLVITDLIMPEKEGIETIKDLKALNPDARIIAISGGGINDPKIYLNLAAKLGTICTFVKPVDNEILLSTIKKILS
ncbi:MAG: response regulator [Proteobacteria bacterium]|nr:response regulator [Pseudomonadota bacterium]MBU1542463.1 response regulator [Pseudomonadota bacterium]